MASNAKTEMSASGQAAAMLSLRAQLNTSIHSLWTVYAAVGGAAAAFGATADIRWLAALAVTVMFWVFTGGHLALLRQTLRAGDAVRLDIAEALDAKRLTESPLQRALAEGAAEANRNPLGKNTAIHLTLDLAITAAIWATIIWRDILGLQANG